MQVHMYIQGNNLHCTYAYKCINKCIWYISTYVYLLFIHAYILKYIYVCIKASRHPHLHRCMYVRCIVNNWYVIWIQARVHIYIKTYICAYISVDKYLFVYTMYMTVSVVNVLSYLYVCTTYIHTCTIVYFI